MISTIDPDKAFRISLLLRKPTSNLQDLLADIDAMKMIRENDPEFSELYVFFSNTSFNNHLNEAISYSLCGESEQLSKMAFILFSKSKPSKMDAERFNTILLNGATEVLMQKKISETVLSRLSSLLLFSIQNFQERSVETLGPIFQLLHYLDNNGVLEMFTSILSQDPLFAGLQGHMVEADFAAAVINSINKSDKRNLSFYLAIIRMAAQNPILAKNFQRTDVAKILLNLISNKKIEILNELWRAITALLSPKTASTLRSAVGPAIEIVGDSYMALNMFRTFAFDFLGKIIMFDDESAQSVFDGQVPEISMRLLLQFDNCSNLIASIFKFYHNGIEKSYFKDWIITSLVPFLIMSATTDGHTAAIAHSFNFLTFLSTKAQSDPQLSGALSSVTGYPSFINEFLIPYNVKLNDKYGGGFVSSTKRRNSHLFVD